MSDVFTKNSVLAPALKHFTRRARWAFLIALWLALCTLALAPDTPGSNTKVIKEARLLGESDSAVATVKLRHHDDPDLEKNATRGYQLQIPIGQAYAKDALLITGVFPNFSVQVGDQVIFDSQHDPSDPRISNESRPHLIALPPNWRLLAPDGSVLIKVYARAREASGLSQVWFGPADEIVSSFQRQYGLLWIGTHTMVGVYLLAAVAAIAFWNSDRNYKSPAWFAGFCGFSSVGMMMGMLSAKPFISWPVHLHFAIFFVGMACICLVQFILEKTELKSAKTTRSLQLLTLGFVCSAIAFYESVVPFRYALIIDFSCVALGIWILYALIVSVVRKSDPLNWILLMGVSASLLFGIHSIVVGWVVDVNAGNNYSLQFGPLPIALTMGWVIIRRYARTKLRAEALNKRLASRVQARELQLQTAFASIADLQQEEAVRGERERFMRDMHDGLGAQLITSLKMAQRGNLNPHQMREILQECLDELRFSIESLKPTADDLLTVLGSYRYRLEPRLKATGIELRWDMDQIPEGVLSALTISQILRIVNEAVSNALKHTDTVSLDILGKHLFDAYSISVRDYGKGFDFNSSKDRGLGLGNLHQRASQIGAQLIFKTSFSGTQIMLIVPLSQVTQN